MTNALRKLSLITSAAALASSPIAHAQTGDPAPAAGGEIAKERPASPALWKVADEDTTVYLFGTVHFLPDGLDWYNDTIAQALTSSDKYVSEIHIPKGSEMQMQAEFTSKGTLPPGESLRDMLNEEQKASYEAGLAKIGIPVNAFDTFEPWYAAFTLSIVPLLQNGYTARQGVEAILTAKAGDMPRGELESVAFQVAMLDEMPVETQITQLTEVAERVDEIVPTIDKIVAEWKVGDTSDIDELMSMESADPLLAETIFFARNRNWAEWIDTRLDTPGTVFVAVGAGHLAGEKSVQNILESRGIKSIRVQ